MTNPFIFTYKGKYAPAGTWEQLNTFQKHLLSGKLTDIPINPSWEDFESTKLSYPTPDKLQEGTEADIHDLEFYTEPTDMKDYARLKQDEQPSCKYCESKEFNKGGFCTECGNKREQGEAEQPISSFAERNGFYAPIEDEAWAIESEQPNKGEQESKTVQEKPEERELIEAAKYGYDYHAKTQFPEMSFEDNCKNNFLQFLQGHQSHHIQQEPQESEEATDRNIEDAAFKLTEEYDEDQEDNMAGYHFKKGFRAAIEWIKQQGFKITKNKDKQI